MSKTNLMPIKVKLTTGVDGKNQFPKFNDLDSKVRNGMDFATFIDKYGIGWHYSEEGYDEGVEPDTWIACTLVPKAFADAAAEKFSDQVTIISEAEFEDFYDNDAMSKQSTEHLDTKELQGLVARIQLEEMASAPTVEPSPEILELRKKMLDPNDPKPGIRKNPRRKWKDKKKLSGFSLDPSVPK